MADIVERLRAEGAMTGYYHVPAIQREAAAEIEWLREESERLRAEVVLLEATSAEAADEIDRLRAAVAAARREGIEAAWGVVADEPVPKDGLSFEELMERDERMMARIRALLVELGHE